VRVRTSRLSNQYAFILAGWRVGCAVFGGLVIAIVAKEAWCVMRVGNICADQHVIRIDGGDCDCTCVATRHLFENGYLLFIWSLRREVLSDRNYFYNRTLETALLLS
jgi:hypothetical protein